MLSYMQAEKHSYHLVFLFFSLLFALFLFLLSHRPLATPDEGRYVEIPREMLETGEYITPHLNGLPYFEKPPLTYWITAASLYVFGENTFAARIPLAIFAFFGCFALYIFMRTKAPVFYSLTPSFVLATSTLYFGMARILTLDLFVSIWITLAMLSFYQSTQKPHKPLLSVFYGLSMAGAVMTKGFIGVVLPGFTILCWIAYQQNGQLLKKAFHPYALLAFFVFATPWHVLVAMHNPSFAWFYFVHEHFLRYTTVIHGRFQPFWFFIPVVILGSFPWIVFGMRLEKKRENTSKPSENVLSSDLKTFLWFWVITFFCFFSLGQSKLIPYILPILPPLSLLIAPTLNTLLENNSTVPPLNAFAYSALCVLLAACIVILRYHNIIQITEGLLCERLLSGLLFGIALIFAATALLTLFLRGEAKKYFLCIAFSHIAVLLLASYGDPLVQRLRPIDDVASFIKKRMNNNENCVIVYGFYPQDLPVYLKQNVHVLAYRGEMSFGAKITPQQNVLIEGKSAQRLFKNNRCFIVALERDLKFVCTNLKRLFPHTSLIYQKSPYVVLSNKNPEKPS